MLFANQATYYRQDNPVYLKDQIQQLDGEWQACLEERIQDGSLGKLDSFLYEEKKSGKIIFPTNFFRALSLSKFNKTKVIIIGQDPYHGEENGIPQANGLAFSVQSNMQAPPSLKNIFKELKQEYPEKFSTVKAINPCLASWAKQGVLMINTVLSVEKMCPRSHHNVGWELITETIISTLVKKKSHLVFLLWGRDAQKKQAIINKHDHHKKHLILLAPHPSPLSAYKGFFGCNHFKLTNQFLESKNSSAINWNSIVTR